MPRSLNEAGTPCPPMVRIQPESMLQLLTVEASELVSNKLEVICTQCKSFHYFLHCSYCSGGRWQAI
ncbi:hypothetical protein LINGRAHAP2_LOCUS7908, partial [Linum grandiflorum]